MLIQSRASKNYVQLVRTMAQSQDKINEIEKEQDPMLNYEK
jgi:hypothetical protein